MRLNNSDRPGFALAVSMMAIVVIGALIAGAFFASTQEYRVGRNTLVGQRAFAVAEYGLNREISEWDRSRNLPGGMQVGAIDSSRVWVTDGDSAFVKITKLNDNTFWVVSEGEASIGNAQLRSRARTNQYVRIAYPTVNVRGAVTTAGDIDMSGASRIRGADQTSASQDMRSWSQCDSITPEDMAGVSVGPTATVGGASGISGDPAVERSQDAADSLTYISYGSETWNSLVRNADVKLSAADGDDPNPNPVGDSISCNVANENNWGEPLRQSGYIRGCRNYFPIIYYNGDLHLRSNGRGQGILLVDGDLIVNGRFEFYGIIVVKDDIERGNGTAQIYGTVMSRNFRTQGNDNSNTWRGTQDVNFSRCAVESALRGSAILTPVRQRGWAQLF